MANVELWTQKLYFCLTFSIFTPLEGFLMNTISGRQQLSEFLIVSNSTQYKNLSELESLLTSEKDVFNSVLKIQSDEFKDSDIDEIRVRFSGKKSPLQELLKSLRVLSPEERKGAGQIINELKTFIEKELSIYVVKAQEEIENRKLNLERDDLSLPLPESKHGSRHPISVVARDLIAPLRRMGFTVIDGPEIEKDFYNFEALNIPAEHPAREMQDSFFLASEWVLRTQTSSVQAHAMMERELPLRVVCPGYVYRNEFDMTHVPTFRQFECLVVDKGVTMAHLRSTLDAFFKEVFGRPVKLRLRSSYFPFTEPSAEIDVECQQCFGKGCRSCKHTGWLEMGGCGMINRAVLEKCGINSSEYSGFAFGMGIDRIAMSKYAVSDLRAMFEGDVNFLKEFKLV